MTTDRIGDHALFTSFSWSLGGWKKCTLPPVQWVTQLRFYCSCFICHPGRWYPGYAIPTCKFGGIVSFTLGFTDCVARGQCCAAHPSRERRAHC